MKYIGGFLMALADSVPGVSGGTIAFLLGIYDDFINSINYLISGTNKQRKWAFFFLLRLGCGWIVGFVLAVLVLTSLFEHNIYRVSSLFLGFIIFSIPLICMEEKESLKNRYLNLVFTVLGIAIVAAITILNPNKSNSTDVMAFSLGNALFVFIAGMIAISAMVLPGISGSTILLILGLYMPIMNSIKKLLHMDFSKIPIVACFGFGVIAGALITFKVVKWALASFRSQTIYLVIGLMLGSLYAIVRGPETLDTPQKAMTLSTFSLIFFLLGGAVIGGLQLLKRIKPEEKTDAK